jgi:hypothetical protein
MPPSSYDLNWSLILPSASDAGRFRSNASGLTAPTRGSSSAEAAFVGLLSRLAGLVSIGPGPG